MDIKKIRVRAEMIPYEAGNQLAFGSLIIDEAIRIEQVRLMKREDDEKAYLAWPAVKKEGKYENMCFIADRECYELCLEEAVKATAYSLTRQTLPQISTQVTMINQEPLLALATVKYGCINICNVRIMKGEKGMFVAFPAKKNKLNEYVEVCHPISRDVRQSITETVLKDFQALQTKLKKNTSLKK